MPYQFQSRIRYSEIGENGKLSVPGLINYYQDCSTFQSEELGNGICDLSLHRRVWVLAYWQIELNRLPRLGENVTIQTWAHSFKGFQGERNYRMLGKDGEVLSYANSLWIYVNLESGHPARVEKEVQELYPIEPALEMERTSRKIQIPFDGETQSAFQVGRHHLDTNHHVNNAQYIDMAQEYLEKEEPLSRIRAEYKNQAVLGDIVVPVVYREKDRVVVDLRSTEQKSYAIVEFSRKTNWVKKC